MRTDNLVIHSSAAENIMKVTFSCGTRLNGTSVSVQRILPAEMSWRCVHYAAWYVGHTGRVRYISLQQVSTAQVLPAPSACTHVPTRNSSSSHSVAMQGSAEKNDSPPLSGRITLRVPVLGLLTQGHFLKRHNISSSSNTPVASGGWDTADSAEGCEAEASRHFGETLRDGRQLDRYLR